ncbi:hypothetical protein [Vogesella sp. LIG4]|uniref:hypothetical protein n=1 Tax=Vogesella sp. LIG4 TaxID=1192162 RepID=UPI00081FB452|nr:hypothetical protein [Vogesella sp. LIG4]SCK09037.1 hypothetical protein PSELUDRAFT_0584 [Vogesella sp. LIG4]
MTKSRFPARCLVLCGSALLLSACSSGPSASDAQQALKVALGECPQVDVSNVEKINGIANGDSYYTLQVKYSLNITPLESSAQRLQQLNAFIEKQKQQLPLMEARIAEIDAKVASGELQRQPEEDETSGPYAKAMTAYSEAKNFVRNFNGVLSHQTAETRALLADDLRAACPGLPRNVAKDYSNADLESFGDTIQIDYTHDGLQLVKSDNGWIAN